MISCTISPHTQSVLVHSCTPSPYHQLSSLRRLHIRLGLRGATLPQQPTTTTTSPLTRRTTSIRLRCRRMPKVRDATSTKHAPLTPVLSRPQSLSLPSTRPSQPPITGATTPRSSPVPHPASTTLAPTSRTRKRSLTSPSPPMRSATSTAPPTPTGTRPPPPDATHFSFHPSMVTTLLAPTHLK